MIIRKIKNCPLVNSLPHSTPNATVSAFISRLIVLCKNSFRKNITFSLLITHQYVVYDLNWHRKNISSRFSSNSKAFPLEFVVNLEEIFLRCYIHNDKINKFKFSIPQYRVIRRVGVYTVSVLDVITWHWTEEELTVLSHLSSSLHPWCILWLPRPALL